MKNSVPPVNLNLLNSKDLDFTCKFPFVTCIQFGREGKKKMNKTFEHFKN